MAASNPTIAKRFMTMTELLEAAALRRESGKTGSIGGSEVSHTEGASERRKVNSLNLVNAPAISRSLTDKEVIKELKAVPHKVLIAVAPVKRDILDPRFDPEGKKLQLNFISSNLTWVNFMKNGEMFSYLKNTLMGYSDDDEVRRGRLMLETVNDYIGTSGTSQGLINRFVTGLSTAVVAVRCEDDLCNDVKRILKFNKSKIDLKGLGLVSAIKALENSPVGFKINPKSNSGMPFTYSIDTDKIDVMALTIEMGEELLRTIASGNLQAYMIERPALCVALLKNKTDVYTMTQLYKKIRPYYVFPLHWRLLFSVLQHLLMNASVGFWTDSSSFSAVGFSWNDGGGDRLYDWIAEMAEKPYGLYGISFSDDNLWVAKTEDGTVVIMNPDYSHLDMSVHGSVGKIALKIWSEVFKGRVDKAWGTVLQMNTLFMFQHITLVYKSLTYLKKGGISSGLPGTTKMGEVASAIAFSVAKRHYLHYGVKDLEACKEWFNKAVDLVKEEVGLIVKIEDTYVGEFKLEQPEYHFTFLGQRLVRYEGSNKSHYLPISDHAKLVRCLVVTKRNFARPELKVVAALERARSVVASGGWSSSFIYETCRQFFQDFIEKVPAGLLWDDEGIPHYEGLDSERDKLVEYHFPNPTFFPSVEWCKNLYLPLWDTLVEGIVEEASNTEEMKESIVQRYDEMLEEIDWDEEEPMDFSLPLNFEPVSLGKLPMPKVIPEEKQVREDEIEIPYVQIQADLGGRVQPLPLQAKTLYNKQWVEEQVKRRELIKMSGGGGKPYRRKPRIGSYATGFSKEYKALATYLYDTDSEEAEEDLGILKSIARKGGYSSFDEADYGQFIENHYYDDDDVQSDRASPSPRSYRPEYKSPVKGAQNNLFGSSVKGKYKNKK
jgi:hypothetical protein